MTDVLRKSNDAEAYEDDVPLFVVLEGVVQGLILLVTLVAVVVLLDFSGWFALAAIAAGAVGQVVFIACRRRYERDAE